MKFLTSRLLLLAFIACLAVPLAHAQSAPDSMAAGEKKEEPKPAPVVKTEKAMKKMKIVKVDINSAEKEDLLEVKGIDDATADKIIAGRPYTSKAQLKTKNIVDAKTYKMISSHLVAKKAKKMAS